MKEGSGKPRISHFTYEVIVKTLKESPTTDSIRLQYDRQNNKRVHIRYCCSINRRQTIVNILLRVKDFTMGFFTEINCFILLHLPIRSLRFPLNLSKVPILHWIHQIPIFPKVIRLRAPPNNFFRDLQKPISYIIKLSFPISLPIHPFINILPLSNPS